MPNWTAETGHCSMMDTPSEPAVDPAALRIDDLPARVEGGSTVLVAAAGDPARYGVPLEILRQRGRAADLALVVTTTERGAATLDGYDPLDGDRAGPALAIVDTVSEGQSVSAVYDETPVVFTPSPGDLERLVIALSDVSRGAPPSSGDRHLVVQSLTPLLAAAPTERVRAVLERIRGLRTGDGLCLLGIDYTAHDEATMRRVAEGADGVLWVTQPSPDRLAFRYEPSGGRYTTPNATEPSGN